jgi:hypothetical protein
VGPDGGGPDDQPAGRLGFSALAGAATSSAMANTSGRTVAEVSIDRMAGLHRRRAVS